MLGCGKCGKPICPRCSVATPVGFRCESCAQVRKNPMLVMNAGEHATAASAALVLALAGGVVWALVNGALGGFLSIFAAAGVGYMISEGLMRATNRKPVAYLRYAAGAAAILAFFAGNVLTPILVRRRADHDGVDPLLGRALRVGPHAVGTAYRRGLEPPRPLDDPRRRALGLHRGVADGPLASHSGGARLQYPASAAGASGGKPPEKKARLAHGRS